jgi:tetratricopeptide (TPR) repeat protein
MATPATKPAQPRWLTWAALAACALGVWLVYGASRHGAFVVWDDDYNLQQNPHLGGLTWENLRWMFTDTSYSRRYFPLTWLGWNVQRDLFGLTPYSAHLGNILFHVLNTALVFSVIKAALRIWTPPENKSNPWAATVAATLGALLWALHPLRVEVVAWASGRIYAQAACFLLVATWCYLKSLEAASGSVASRRFRWASVGALAFSLLTYPLALGFVGVLFAFELYRPQPPFTRLPFEALAKEGHSPSRHSPAERDDGGSLVTRHSHLWPFLAVTLLLFGVTLWARTNVEAVGWRPPVTLADFGVVPRVMQACYVWVYYLAKPLLPLHLSPYYTQLLSFSPGDLPFVLSLMSVVLLSVVLFFRRRAWPGLWLLWLCHLLILVPVLGLTEHPHFTNDRYSYLDAVPWSVGLAFLIVRLWPRRLAVLVPAAFIVVFSVLSLAQVAVWQNTETLGLHMIAEMGNHPRRFDIYSRISSALRSEGKLAESNSYYLKSLAGDPHAFANALAQARTYEEHGQAQEALGQYMLAAQLRPDLAEPRYKVGAMLLAADHASDALMFLQEAVRLAPGSPEIQITLGWALNRCGQSPEAIPHFETALRQLPDDAAAHSGLGSALLAIGRPREAIPHFETVLRQYPNSAPAHYNLGLALLDGTGRTAEAAAHFETALKLQPDYPAAREALERSRR